MTNIQGSKVTLRAVEPTDLDTLYIWENETSLWGVSGTRTPFSRHTLELFIESQLEDIFTSKQLRLMICTLDEMVIGMVDIFDFEPSHHRAGVGIMVDVAHQGRGYAREALSLLEEYGRTHLELHQLWCNVEEDNLRSIGLFESSNYERVGIKKGWNFTPNGYKSEILFQKLL